MKNRAFLVNTLVLTATALILRAIGIYLTAYLNRQIGSEGVGLYHLIYSVYIMASTLATAGFALAVSRMVAEEYEKREGRAVRAVMIRSMALSVSVSLIVAGLLFFGAEFIGGVVLRDERTVLPLRVMAPSLPFMAVSACLRGYFLAVRKAPKAASASLIEQLFRIAVTVRILAAFAPRGLAWACTGVVLGSTLAEVLSCLYVFVLYRLERRAARRVRSESPPGLARRIVSIALPMAASASLRTGLRTAESLLIPVGLRQSGLNGDTALTQYGVVTGMAMPVLFFPSSLLLAVSMLIVPEMARCAAAHNDRRVRSMGSRVMRLTLLGSILVGCVFFVFAGELSMALYKSRAAGNVIRILAPLVPLLYLDHVVDGMLGGLGQQMKTLQINSIDSTLRIAMILILVPLMGMNGYMVTLFVSTVLNASLSIGRLLRVSGIRVPLGDWVIKPLMAAALSSLLMSMLCRWAAPELTQAGTLAIPAIAGAVVVYGGLLLLTGCLGREDIRWFLDFFRAPAPGAGS